MQGQRKHLDSYPNAVDYGQGATSESTDNNQSTSRNDLNPQPFPHPNLMSYSGANQDVQMLREKGSGEPSSSSKSKAIVNDDGLKTEQCWPYSFRAGQGSNSGSQDTSSTGGHNACSNLNHSSSLPHLRATSNAHRPVMIPGFTEDYHKQYQNLRENAFSDLLDEYTLAKTDQIPSTNYNHFGPSIGSSSYSLEEMDVSGSSTGGWGQSSKRKLHEGTSSTQSYSSGTAGSFIQNSNSMNYDGPYNNAFNTNNFPLNPWPHTDDAAVQLNQGNPAQFIAHAPNHKDEDAECSMRNFNSVGSSRHLSQPNEIARQFNFQMFEPSSQPQLYSGSLGVRSASAARPNLRSPQIESEDVYISLPSNGVHNMRHSANSVSRSGDLLALRSFGPNMEFLPQDDDYTYITATEPRNIGQDPTNWSLATGPDNSEMFSSTSRSRTGSSLRSLSPPPPWIRHHNPPSHIQQRFPGFAPWTLFPSYDADTRNQCSLSPPLPSVSSGTTPEALLSRPRSRNELQVNRRLGPMSERLDDAVIRLPHHLRETAAEFEGRRMLFSEDYMLFDPFVYHGLVEMHDRHRDMRLDVDNMTYEELLALEERIGDVNTGLSEEVIRKTMKQHIYDRVATIHTLDLEPCSVCQEEFNAGEVLGKLDCGHDFHVHCIRQWLMLKNLCPICKTTGLAT